MTDVALGTSVVDAAGRPIGRVEAAFADYLLVRTVGLPVDLYVPADRYSSEADRVVTDAASATEAYDLWHRPLKRAPHP